MKMIVRYAFDGCVGIFTGEADASEASKKALSMLDAAKASLIGGRWLLTPDEEDGVDEVDNRQGEVLLVLVGEIAVPVEAENEEEAGEASWKILMADNHKMIDGFGKFEWHDGNIIDIKPANIAPKI